MADYNDPNTLIRVMSYNLKRIADTLESINETSQKSHAVDLKHKAMNMSDTFEFGIPENNFSTGKIRAVQDSESLRNFLNGLTQ